VPFQALPHVNGSDYDVRFFHIASELNLVGFTDDASPLVTHGSTLNIIALN
jgi:hypothetical protein